MKKELRNEIVYLIIGMIASILLLMTAPGCANIESTSNYKGAVVKSTYSGFSNTITVEILKEDTAYIKTIRVTSYDRERYEPGDTIKD